MELDYISKKMNEHGFIKVQKALIHNLGADGANIYSELVNKAFYYEENKQTKDGWFFCTVDDLEHEVSVKKDKQIAILKDLQNKGLIEIKYQGKPRTRYVKVLLNENAINSVFEDTRTT